MLYIWRSIALSNESKKTKFSAGILSKGNASALALKSSFEEAVQHILNVEPKNSFAAYLFRDR